MTIADRRFDTPPRVSFGGPPQLSEPTRRALRERERAESAVAELELAELELAELERARSWRVGAGSARSVASARSAGRGRSGPERDGVTPVRRRDRRDEHRPGRSDRRPLAMRGITRALSCMVAATVGAGALAAYGAGAGDALDPVGHWYRRHLWSSSVTLVPADAPRTATAWAGPSPAEPSSAALSASPSEAGSSSEAGSIAGGAPTTIPAAANLGVPSRPLDAPPSGSSGSSSGSAGSSPVATAAAKAVLRLAASTTVSSSSAEPGASSGSAGTPVAGGRRGFWNSIGRTPTQAQLQAAVGLYSVVALNPWETDALHRLKQLDPSIQVLMYKDLSSVRSYDSSANPPGGVTLSQADANPSWYAVDRQGKRIQWSGYAGHWQMAVWNPSYQAAWAANVASVVASDQWDGVLADNDLSTLKWYSDATLAGTSSTADTDARLRDGLQVLLDRAGAAVNAAGKKLVPNISDARLYAGRWTAHARYGGGMEENFVHFGSQAVTDWGATGWLDQTAEMAGPGMSLAVTRTDPGDLAGARYGYASLLVRGDEEAFWMPGSGDASYAEPQSIPELTWKTGAPAESATKHSNGAWTRRWAGVWAAVNPTTSSVTVTAPPGATDASGNSVTTLTLGPAGGTILKLS